MPESERNIIQDIARCLRFIEGWYSYRKLTKKEILLDFDFERSIIGGYLTPHIDRNIVNQALDEYKSKVFQSISI